MMAMMRRRDRIWFAGFASHCSIAGVQGEFL